MEITSTPKRLRALPRVWQRFLYLEIDDGFYIGRCPYVKTGFFKATNRKDGGFRVIRVWPWTRVQTDVLVRDARPGGKSSVVDEVCDEVNRRITEVQNSGRTHFVGDDCPGGHADKPINNDNNITGPTS